tara:strand:+ start:227 stop:490 length:264 start_codon:yes stop_codon:yes gene_type:complete
MAEGSHHECIRVGNRIVGHIRITNSGKILSVWFKEPYNQLFLPENPCKCTPIEMCDQCFDELSHQDEDQDDCICKEDYNDPNCPECY